MVKTSVLNDALNAINNAEKAGKRQVLIHPSSKVIVKFLSVMQRHGTFVKFFSQVTREWVVRDGTRPSLHCFKYK